MLYFFEVVCLKWSYYHNISVISSRFRKKKVFVVINAIQPMMCPNIWKHYGLMVELVCLHITLSHYHHHVDWIQSMEHVICLSGICCRMCLTLTPFSHLSIMQYMGLCVCSLLIYLLMIEKQRYALYVLLRSREFFITLDCFIMHFLVAFTPNLVPCHRHAASLHCQKAYPFDDWYLANMPSSFP